MAEPVFNPLYNFLAIQDAPPELNEGLRQIADSLVFLRDNSTGGGGPVVGNLDDLQDVTITNPQTGQVLTYNGTQWVNQSGSGALPSVLDDLGDVTITAPRAQQTLRYNGAQWVNVGPVDLTFAYDVDDRLEGITGAGTNIDFAYNSEGQLATVDNQTDVLTFGYDPVTGQLIGISVSPS